MAGVRGFRDPNVQINPNGRSTFYQSDPAHSFSQDKPTDYCRDVDSTLSNDTDFLIPFYAGYLGGNATEALQCTYGGDNGWDAMHEVYHEGLNDKWAVSNTPWSLMYLKRDDLPVQFELAEGYTVGDMYQVRISTTDQPHKRFFRAHTP
jgi:phospholipase C